MYICVCMDVHMHQCVRMCVLACLYDVLVQSRVHNGLFALAKTRGGSYRG